MNRYSRILHHIDIEDVKLKCLDEISAKKIEEERKKEEEAVIFSEYIRWKYSWRKELSEQMTTSALMYTVLSPEGDESLDTIAAAVSYSVLDNSTLRSSGTGVGTEGGFNTAQDYLDVGDASGLDSAILKDIDMTQADAITFSVIIGNNSNGGKTPTGNLGIYVQSMGTAANPTGGYGPLATWTPWYTPADAANDPNYNSKLNFTSIITKPSDVGDGSVQDFTVNIPPWHQRKNARFALNVGSADANNYGIVAIKVQRKYPMNVWVGLDSPEASSFVRVGQGSSKTTPKKRKKKVQDILAAGEKYTTTNIAPNFPGSSTKLDDPQMPDKQIADIQQANRDVVSDKVKGIWDIEGDKFSIPEIEVEPIKYDQSLSAYERSMQPLNALTQTYSQQWGLNAPRIVNHQKDFAQDSMSSHNISFDGESSFNHALHSKMNIVGKDIFSPAELKMLDAPGRTSVTVNGKKYQKFEDLSWDDQKEQIVNDYRAWEESIDKKHNEMIDEIRRNYQAYLDARDAARPGRVIFGAKPANWWYEHGSMEHWYRYPKDSVERTIYDLVVQLSKDKMDLINTVFAGMNNRLVEVDPKTGLPVESIVDSSDSQVDRIGELIGLSDEEKDELEHYLANVVDHKDVKGGLMDFLLDKVAGTLKVGFAKDVFDYHVDKWMKNPTDKPQDVTRLVRPNDMKALTDWANRINFNARLPEDEIAIANQDLNWRVAKNTKSLRNVLGNLDPDRGDGITKITPNYVEITKTYDFDKNWRDYLGGGSDWLVALGALGYAASKGALGGTPTMNTVIRVPLNKKIKSTPKTKRQALSLDEPIVPSTTSFKTSKKKKKKVTESVITERKLKTAKEFFKQADIKPTFPENPPPELDPKTGMHPNYGKQAARYKKLDPVSARSMPKTGDPEIDAEVEKAKKKPK